MRPNLVQPPAGGGALVAAPGAIDSRRHRGPVAPEPEIVGPGCDAPRVMADFDAELWIWDVRRLDSWTFVSLPAEASEEIRELAAGRVRGFGSVRVRVTVGGSVWTTSIFPDSKRGAYVLPVKRAVRKAEGVDTGDTVRVTVELMDF
jgi:hypothetical protein